MRLLLDTHVAIWSIMSLGKMPGNIQELIFDHSSEVFVSVVTLWEIPIKAPQGREHRMPITAAAARQEFDAADLSMLTIEPEHAIAVTELPMLHGDPFDRMILAQAKYERLRLVTADTRLAQYSQTIITW